MTTLLCIDCALYTVTPQGKEHRSPAAKRLLFQESISIDTQQLG